MATPLSAPLRSIRMGRCCPFGRARPLLPVVLPSCHHALPACWLSPKRTSSRQEGTPRPLLNAGVPDSRSQRPAYSLLTASICLLLAAWLSDLDFDLLQLDIGR